MNINLTLIGQSITFAIFVWFCMKFIWPFIIEALDDRKQKIADGLAAAERGAKEQQMAEAKAADILKEAKEQARVIISQAEKRHGEIVDQAKQDAKTEAAKIVAAAHSEIEQETNRAREELRGKVIDLALAASAKILEREVKVEDHNAALEKLSASL